MSLDFPVTGDFLVEQTVHLDRFEVLYEKCLPVRRLSVVTTFVPNRGCGFQTTPLVNSIGIIAAGQPNHPTLIPIVYP